MAIQRRRHKSRKRRDHRLHAKLFHPANNLLLQLPALVEPRLRKRPVMFINIPHAMPREKGGTREVAQQFIVGQTIAVPDPLPDCFLAYHRERHVDSMKSHPVELFLPLLPPPESSCVSESAHIVVKAVLVRRSDRGFWKIGKALGKMKIGAAPRDLTMGGEAEIMIRSSRQCDRTVAANRDLAARCFDLEDVVGSAERNHNKSELIGMLSYHTVQHFIRSLRNLLLVDSCLLKRPRTEEREEEDQQDSINVEQSFHSRSIQLVCY